MRFIRQLFFGAAALALGACAVGPDYRQPPAPLPAQWHAPLPHGGELATLAGWWAQFDDPLLAELIGQAEAVSPTLAQARSRIVQSRADAAAARNVLWPSLNLGAAVLRSGGGNLVNQRLDSAALDAGWEVDLFGGGRRTLEAAAARQEGAQAAWHEARVSLAAEVAREYVGLRAGEALLADAEADLASRRTTEQLTRGKVQAGFGAPADGALAEASLAEAATRVIAQRAECDISVKALVALVGLDEAALRERLQARSGKLPQPAVLAVGGLPVQVLSHRPDLVVAERELAAASADIGGAQATLYPRLSLVGSVGVQYQRLAGVGGNSSVWRFGPSLDLPIFDAGRRLANVAAAQARYDSALAVYKSQVRQAVREVEQALVRLDSANRREVETGRAAEGNATAFCAAEARWRAGIGSQLALEEFRRLQVNARMQHLAVRHEAVAAWVALYRAVGGGWEKE